MEIILGEMEDLLAGPASPLACQAASIAACENPCRNYPGHAPDVRLTNWIR